MSNKITPDSGLNSDDVRNIKVIMRSLNDAIKCSEEIAQKDTSTDHYKDYLRVLVESIKKKNVSVILTDAV